MFTKQHYILIAETIAKSQNLEDLTQKLRQIFKADNQRFNETRFLSYIAKVKGQA